jgi:cyclic di-GMP phosphodiesterase Gmr
VTIQYDWALSVIPGAPGRDDLGRALDSGDLQLVFQPVVRMATGRPVGAETLVRWNWDGQSLAPPAFWHLVDSDLARRVGRYVIDAACRQLAAWRAGGGCPALSVNVDARELCTTWIDDIKEALDRYAIPAEALTLELTETARLASDAAECIARVLDTGVGIALDDAATGYNALSAVREIPLTELKLDRGFVAKIGHSRNDAIVRALVSVAQDLDLRLVAEGVETEEQSLHLQDEGVQFAQGYLFSRPLDADEFESYWSRSTQADPEPESLLDDLLSQGLSPSSIAAVLNQRGVPSPNGRRWHPRTVAREIAVSRRVTKRTHG